MLKTNEKGETVLVIEWNIEDIVGVLENSYGLKNGKDFNDKDSEEILVSLNDFAPDVDWPRVEAICENWAYEHDKI